MGAKYLEAVKQRLHAIKEWSPDEIRVSQLPLFTYLLSKIGGKQRYNTDFVRLSPFRN